MRKLIYVTLWQLFSILSFFTIANAEFALMLGSFRSQQNAESYVSSFSNTLPENQKDLFIEEVQFTGKSPWFRVCVGPFANKNEAETAQKDIKQRGRDSVVVSTKTAVGEVTPLPKAGNRIATGTINGIKESNKKAPALVSPDASHKKSHHKQKPPHQKNRLNLDGSSAGFHVKGKGEHKTANSNDEENEVIVLPGDVLSLQIPMQKQMSHNYDLDPEGRIFMLSIGEVKLGGLSLLAAHEKITVLLKQIVPIEDKPVLKLVESMRYIQISGGINYPGWYRVPQKARLDDLIDMAGGLVVGADFSEIKIRRRSKTGLKEFKVRASVSLAPNDIIVIPTPKKFERKIDSGDLLFVNIPEKPTETSLTEIERKVSQNKIEVDKSGYIYIPNYGHIFVKNLLPSEVSKIISSRLPKYLARSAKVHVNIIEKKHYVQINGHVSKPGWYNIAESENIQGALSAAGGAVDGAIMSRITVTRKWGGKTRKVRINLYQYTVTGDLRLLTPVHENDSIFVPISSAFGDVKRTLSQWQPPQSKLEEDTGTKVRIFGAVVNPGVYEPKEDMNILDLLVMAGGNRDDADLAKTLLIRENKTETFDLNHLIIQSTAGAEIIPKVQNGDSVYISFVKKSGYEKQEPKKMIRIFGAVKKPGIYEASPNMNIIDVFSLANGQTYDADLKKINITRTNGTFENLDLQEYFDAKDPDPTNLPIIRAGDTVYVHYLQHLNLEKKEPIYLLGKVKNPGQYQLATGGMTVYQMLAYAGGLDEWADTESIRIIRMVNGRQRNIAYSLKKALSGKYPELNIRLRSFDTIYVP